MAGSKKRSSRKNPFAPGRIKDALYAYKADIKKKIPKREAMQRDNFISMKMFKLDT